MLPLPPPLLVLSAGPNKKLTTFADVRFFVESILDHPIYQITTPSLSQSLIYKEPTTSLSSSQFNSLLLTRRDRNHIPAEHLQIISQLTESSPRSLFGSSLKWCSIFSRLTHSSSSSFFVPWISACYFSTLISSLTFALRRLALSSLLGSLSPKFNPQA